MINLNNYEEWFLLYADNELTASEKDTVMAFVALHQELRQELEQLLVIKCIPDKHIVFSDKELLHIHDDGIKAITFTPDLTIVYPDKSSLHKSVPVKKINWLRLTAVAASLVLMIGLIWSVIPSNSDRVIAKSSPDSGVINGVVAPLQKKPLTVSAAVDLQTVEVVSVQTRPTLQAISHTDRPEQMILPTAGREEIALQLHAPEPAVELNEKNISASLQTNFSEEVLEAARARMSASLVVATGMVSGESGETSAVNTALLIEDAMKHEDPNIFRGIIRKINRVIQDDSEESEKKFIQVANFQIPVRQ